MVLSFCLCVCYDDFSPSTKALAEYRAGTNPNTKDITISNTKNNTNTPRTGDVRGWRKGKGGREKKEGARTKGRRGKEKEKTEGG